MNAAVVVPSKENVATITSAIVILQLSEVVSLVDEGNGQTRWRFSTECCPSSTQSISTKSCLYLSSYDSLRWEGIYCYDSKCWRRVYVSEEGVAITIFAESGGQKCLWSAGIIMAKYLESNLMRRYLRRNSFGPIRILELGAGAGLTALVAALLGGTVDATEQATCIDFLKMNIALNPDIVLSANVLQWSDECNIGGNYNIILGCDITYDRRNFVLLFELFRGKILNDGVILICHDEESCPMSKKASSDFFEIAHRYQFQVETINIYDHLPLRYCSKSIKLWKLYYSF